MGRRVINPVILAVALAVGLFLLAGALQPGFLSLRQVYNVLRLAAFLGIIAAGQTLVILAGGEGIDLSVGAVATLGAILTFRLTAEWGAGPAILVALAAGLAIGGANGLGVTQLGVPPLVMTLGMTLVVEGLILAVTRGQLVGEVPRVLVALVGPTPVGAVPGVLLLWALLAGLVALLLARTRYGKHLYAVGTQRTVATLSGVRVHAVLVATYALSGLAASLGGVVILGYTQQVFLSLGDPYTLPSVAAVVVGGTALAGGQGSYWGTVVGAIVLTLLSSLLTGLQLPEALRQIIYGVVLLGLLSVYGRQRALRT